MGKVAIEVVVGPDVGRQASFDHTPILIGRHPRCDFPLTDPSVSRRHAILRLDENGLSFEDLGSAQGSTVNGERVQFHRMEGVEGRLGVGKSVLKLTRTSPVGTACGGATPTPTPKKIAPFAAGACYCTESVGDQVFRYRSHGPQPAFPELLAGLGRFRPLALLVDPIAFDRVAPAILEPGMILYDWLPAESARHTSPRLYEGELASQIVPAIEETDGCVAYYGDSVEQALDRLRVLARSRSTPDDDANAPNLVPLSRPSILLDMVSFGDPGFAGRLTEEFKAVVMPWNEGDGWVALAGESFRQRLDRFGFREGPVGA